MSTKSVRVGELRRIVESANEFKPVVFGRDISKKQNDEAYASIKKETEKYDGGLTSTKKNKAGGGIGATDNLGMSDLRYDNINKPFMDKVKSQMKGYVSKDAEEKHKDDEFGNASFDNDGSIYKDAKKHAELAKQGKDVASEIGLTGRELSKKAIEDNDETMFESKKRIKLLNFKKIEFLSEGHVLYSVPDEYKKEGNKFIMKDKADNEYLVEWHDDEPSISKKPNMRLVNEQKERMKHLWDYSSKDAFKGTTNDMRLKEDKNFGDMVNKARKLME